MLHNENSRACPVKERKKCGDQRLFQVRRPRDRGIMLSMCHSSAARGVCMSRTSPLRLKDEPFEFGMRQPFPDRHLNTWIAVSLGDAFVGSGRNVPSVFADRDFRVRPCRSQRGLSEDPQLVVSGLVIAPQLCLENR